MSRKFEYTQPVSRFVSPRAAAAKKENTHQRAQVIVLVLYVLFFCIVGRLFYWQVLHRSVLQAQAESQYTRTVTTTAHRGRIFTSDGFALVNNRNLYRMFAQPPVLKESPLAVADKLAPLLVEQVAKSENVSDSAQLAQLREELRMSLNEKLNNKETKWVALRSKIDESTRQKIEDLHIWGLGFDRYEAREYPEASMAAHVVGFVGKNNDGLDQGYFGVEGALDRELRGYAPKQTFLKDALGFHLLFDKQEAPQTQVDGRDVVLTIRRDVQFTVEELLKKGMAKYGASAGEVVVMDPKTGKILAMAAFPNYSPENFFEYPQTLHKNPSVADSYEPGSTFKVLTIAAGIDAGLINGETVCTNCSSAREISDYTIKTWNNEYHPNITMRDALAKSDNIAMIFVAEMLGEKRFVEYVKKFGIGDEIHLDLQEDTSTPIRKDWKHIDLATGSFGQGIATTAMQMVRAVGSIANDGKMMRPQIIEKVVDHTRGTEAIIEPQEERQVISKEAADEVTRMMEYAAGTGEAKWTSSRTHRVAGKTGTAQVPIDGHYDATKTIASYVGFAPPDNPRFVMIVKLRETQSSQWASETAAPLWYEIADRLYLLLNVPADK